MQFPGAAMSWRPPDEIAREVMGRIPGDMREMLHKLWTTSMSKRAGTKGTTR